jgi:RNA polymerase sigma factor (sigma-70 family)
MTEQQLVAGLLNNDQDAIRYVYKTLAPPIYKYVLSNQGSLDDAKDIFQECFVKVWRKISAGAYEHQGKFDAYFIQVARNTWIDQLRQQKKMRFVQDDDYLLARADADDEDALSHLMVHDDRMSALATVWAQWEDTACRDRLQAFHYDRVSTHQLAECEAVPLGTILKRLFDCRKKLFKIVSQTIKNK